MSGDSQHPQHALLRLSGEVGTKARATRRQFRDRLAANVRDALATLPGEASLQVEHDRLYVRLAEGPVDDPAGHPLTRVFGLQSVSWVERRPVTAKAEVLEVGRALFRDAVRGRRFAVRARPQSFA